MRRLSEPSGKPAVVLDIDNTSLESHYHPEWTTPAIPPVLALVELAKQHGASIFFVTDRTFKLPDYDGALS